MLQGVTVDQVCRELRGLHVVSNLSSLSLTCEPSLSTTNEIHVAIVSPASKKKKKMKCSS